MSLLLLSFTIIMVFLRSKPDIKMEPSAGRPMDYQVRWFQSLICAMGVIWESKVSTTTIFLQLTIIMNIY